MKQINIIKTKPKEHSRCTCTNPLYSFSVCAQCKKVIYKKDKETETRRRTVVLSIEITRLLNEFQNIIEWYDGSKPEEFIPIRDEFIERVNSVVKEAFEKENKEIERKEKEKKINKKREQIIEEIIKTENDYCQDIKLIEKYYLTTLKKYMKEDGKKLEEKLKEIEEVSIEINNIMKKGKNIIEEIYQRIDKLKVYEEYFILYHKNIKVFENIRKNEEFENIRNKNKELRQLDIMDFLVKPIQRITKYPLFIREIKPLLVSIDTIELGSKIENKIQEIMKKQNENQRKYLSEEMIKEIEPRLNWKEFGKNYNLSKSNVCLLLFNENLFITETIRKTNDFLDKKEQFNCMLTFTDFILFGRTKLLGKIKICKYIELINCTIDTTNCKPNEIILFYDTINYTIQFSDVSEKSIWITKFNEIPHNHLTKMPLYCDEESNDKSNDDKINSNPSNDVFNILTTFHSTSQQLPQQQKIEKDQRLNNGINTPPLESEESIL
ncbi:hypothetical protein EDI_323950 [Entamoeba dispar SAW760]|uniref:DH domain-containing protein n=1 Tax=Entamoeba dispar (strain ATCC PRA-260 / SAW760) TaxID=370354 RepID=B0EAI1_ENTDS|nr:uncharacterized protein EDI_323950 [Entamoeba dispar SAW760]EDR28453.1 hypothetical protein EDI_323950 [Entamoeba dispar SAW760]|eukprot:EDR28453.1 hypothetical protein EDI_323950 [Entamoeba dispar SAW760]